MARIRATNPNAVFAPGQLEREDAEEAQDEQRRMSMGRAERAASALEKVTDRLNTVIQTAEEQFALLGLGVEASVPFGSDEELGTGPWALRFGKDGRQWRLMVEINDDDPDASHSGPLASSSRAIRVKAISVLPLLMLALVDQAENEASSLVREVERAESFLARMAAK